MSKKSETSWQDSASDWLVSIIIAVALAFCIRTFLVEPYMVEGSSMYPTLVNHERLVVDKLSYFVTDPKKGEIVVFRFPKDQSRDFIKRVIAVGGDTVEMQQGKVFVNGKQLNETYIYHNDPKGKNISDYRKVVVPKDTIFVLGDNRNNSEDSRFADVGFVPLKLVKGRALVAFWPLDKMPGHMTKAKRMMESQIKLVDVVVEMLDARIPRSSTNPMLQDILGSKPKVIALNKIDMADKAQTDVWLEKVKHSGLPVCKIDCSTGKGVKQLISAVQRAAKPVIDKWLKKGVRNRPVRVMIVGIPNVGKSTLINRLVGKNKVMAADKPGVTRGQQWVTIAKGLELLDTPGVLWPKFDDPSVGFALAVTGAIKEDVFDREQAVELLLDLLIRKYPQDLQTKYAVSLEQGDDVNAVMAKIAVARGCLKSGGQLDLDKVVQLVLRDFRAGRLGRFTIDEP